MFKKIVVPLDGSRRAEQAVETAIVIANESDAEIILVRAAVHQPELVEKMAGLAWLYEEGHIREQQALHTAYLETVRKTYLHNYKLAVRLEAPIGRNAAAAILDFTDEEACDLIVMSSHGETGIMRSVLGSTAQRVATHAKCAVLLLRNHHPIRKVALALDGSAFAEQGLAPTQAVATAIGAAVTLLHVEDAQRIDYLAATSPVDAAYLERVAVDYQSNRLEMDTAHLIGYPAAKIVEFSADNRIDLIAMTTHGRSGYQRWQFGSVTQKVLNHTRCSMLIIPNRVLPTEIEAHKLHRFLRE